MLIVVLNLIPLLDKMGLNLTWFAILVAAYFLKGVVPDIGDLDGRSIS